MPIADLVCNPNCKPTSQHGVARGITNQDHRTKKVKLEQTISYRTAQARISILELENR
jgi:hypothetical protein